MKSNYMEINVAYVDDVARALLKSGYQVLLWQDGESDDVVVIEYVHPNYDEARFVPVSQDEYVGKYENVKCE